MQDHFLLPIHILASVSLNDAHKSLLSKCPKLLTSAVPVSSFSFLNEPDSMGDWLDNPDWNWIGDSPKGVQRNVSGIHATHGGQGDMGL